MDKSELEIADVQEAGGGKYTDFQLADEEKWRGIGSPGAEPRGD